MNVTLEEIESAYRLISTLLPPTPLWRNQRLSERYGCDVYFKYENMQPIGSFKIRGATFKISSLTEQEKSAGVIAASAGNHAQGVAWGSRTLGTKALIVMPEQSPLVKIHNTKSLGAEVVLHGSNYDEAFEHAQKLCKESKRALIHAYRDPKIIAGQATAGVEILEQLPDVDIVIGSIGGGGLMAGVGTFMKARKPEVKLWGVQAAGAASMVESLKQRKAISLERVHTFADGVAVRAASEEMRQILGALLEHSFVADDEAIAGAVLTLMEKANTIVEGSGALPLCVLEQVKKMIQGKKIVLILSGGNIDVNLIGRIIDRGLIRAGRRLRLKVLISDRPGSLTSLTSAIAKEGGNILQAVHDRDDPGVALDQTEVALTIETKGAEHSARLFEAIEKASFQVKVLS